MIKRLRLISCAYFIMCGCFSGTRLALATNITLSGNWSPTAEVSMGAGSDLTGNYESPADNILVTIANTSGSNWRVDVKRIDTMWLSTLVLSVMRTGSGSGGGSIYGGSSYQLINHFDGSFISGSSDRNDIPIQLQLNGVSIETPNDKYTTTIVFTVVDIQ